MSSRWHRGPKQAIRYHKLPFLKLVLLIMILFFCPNKSGSFTFSPTPFHLLNYDYPHTPAAMPHLSKFFVSMFSNSGL